MKLGFIIYLLLLLIEGLVALQATGSPMLLALPLAGIIFYGALGGRGGAVPEICRILCSLLMITLGLMTFGNHLHVIFLTLLCLPHFLAATQCVWELQNVGSDVAKRTQDMRVSVFSMAFYAGWGVALMLLQAEDLHLLRWHAQLLAGVVILLSLVAWEASRILRLQLGETTDRLTPTAYWRRVGLVIGLAVLGLIGFSAVLPPIADILCKLSPKWHPPLLEGNLGPPHRPQEAPPTEDHPASADGRPPKQAADESARTGRMRLPQRIQLQQTEAPRAYVQFASPAQAKVVISAGPMYVRGFGLSIYENFTWQPLSTDGYWFQDADDGKKDGHATLSEDTATSVHYQMLIPQADGRAMLALPSVLAVDAPKVYTLPDDWFQLEMTGAIRYGARSDPKIWDRLPSTHLQSANAGLSYLRVPEGKLGDILKQLKDQIFKLNTSPEFCIPALQTFFHDNYTYSTTVENFHHLSPLENFLLDERAGYCDLFATSAALLLRKVNIPTRIGFGYLGGEYHEESGLVSFRQRHAHSWVEVKLEGQGWVICEFTPPAPAQPSTESSPGLAGPTAPDLSAFQDINTPPPAAPVLANSPAAPPLDFLASLNDLWKMISGPATRWSVGSLVLGLALLAWWKRYASHQTPEEKARRAAAARDQQPAYVHALREIATTVGLPTHVGDTVAELRQALSQAGCQPLEFSQLESYHYAVRYADAPPDRKQEASFLTFLKAYRRPDRLASSALT